MDNSNTINDALQNWVPIRLSNNQNELLCRWLYTGNKSFDDPFFDETISKCLSLPENSKGYRVTSTLEMLPDWAVKTNSVPLSAIIFHVSRCGSTLVSQALGMVSNAVSLSEVALFDEILRLPHSNHAITEEYSNQLLAAAIKLYGNKRTGAENRLFIKTDSWHLVFYKRLRALYPDVPFIILYREPAGVLESNKRSKGMQGSPNLVEPFLLGLQNITDDLLHPDNYFGLVLEQYYNLIIEIATNDQRTLLLNYSQGLNEMMERIAKFIGLNVNPEKQAQIAERSKYHAKYPEKKFEELNKSEVEHPLLDKLKKLYDRIERNGNEGI